MVTLINMMHASLVSGTQPEGSKVGRGQAPALTCMSQHGRAHADGLIFYIHVSYKLSCMSVPSWRPERAVCPMVQTVPVCCTVWPRRFVMSCDSSLRWVADAIDDPNMCMRHSSSLLTTCNTLWNARIGGDTFCSPPGLIVANLGELRRRGKELVSQVS